MITKYSREWLDDCDINEWSQEFDEGYENCQCGKKMKDCPYDNGTVNRKNWTFGWETACLDDEFNIFNRNENGEI